MTVKANNIFYLGYGVFKKHMLEIKMQHIHGICIYMCVYIYASWKKWNFHLLRFLASVILIFHVLKL